jgi:hypothetical protein
LLSESSDTDVVFDRLLEEYAVDPTVLSQDMNEFWQSLLDAGLVTLAPDA